MKRVIDDPQVVSIVRTLRGFVSGGQIAGGRTGRTHGRLHAAHRGRQTGWLRRCRFHGIFHGLVRLVWVIFRCEKWMTYDVHHYGWLPIINQYLIHIFHNFYGLNYD